MRISDWSSDVCSSDLPERRPPRGLPPLLPGATRRSAQTSCSSIPCLRCRCDGRLPAAAFVIPSPALLQGRAVHHQTEHLEQHLGTDLGRDGGGVVLRSHIEPVPPHECQSLPSTNIQHHPPPRKRAP